MSFSTRGVKLEVIDGFGDRGASGGRNRLKWKENFMDAYEETVK